MFVIGVCVSLGNGLLEWKILFEWSGKVKAKCVIFFIPDWYSFATHDRGFAGEVRVR